MRLLAAFLHAYGYEPKTLPGSFQQFDGFYALCYHSLKWILCGLLFTRGANDELI